MNLTMPDDCRLIHWTVVGLTMWLCPAKAIQAQSDATSDRIEASRVVYHLSADYAQLESYPLQKTQFGVSYVGSSAADMGNVYELLRARNTRNNDKRLRGTWKGWNEVGDPVYERNDRVSTLLETASDYGAIGGANLQGPIEHPDATTYRISSHDENEWDWDKFSRDSMLYQQHLRGLIDAHGARDYPFVFGIGHEANNDANLNTLGRGRGCVDGIAFMGNINAFHDLVIGKKDKQQGDVIQATKFFEWYQRTIDELIAEYGCRREFLIAAAQPHTNPDAIRTYFKTIYDLVNAHGEAYTPDYIGCHSRWNIPDDERFFATVVQPSRALFAEPLLWQAVPIMCNEFGIYDFEAKYRRSLLGAVRLLNNFERILESPDIAYVNVIYRDRLAGSDGETLYPAFHAFQFYQSMPQSRTRLTGLMPPDMHVLSSRASHSQQAALVWRDESGSGTHTVNFTFANATSEWTKARASLYVMSNADIGAPMTTQRENDDYGLTEYLADGYPKVINGHDKLKDYTFADIELGSGSIAMLKLERLDASGQDPSAYPDEFLNHIGPSGAQYIKTWQWSARNGVGGVDPSWGFFDTRNWTLFAGIDDVSGSEGSTQAAYLSHARVKRGMAGVEFHCAKPALHFDVNVESGDLNPTKRNQNAIGAVRIDFYNGNCEKYDAAVILAGNCCPTQSRYTHDYVPWGYGGTDIDVFPQGQVMGRVDDGQSWTTDLDEQYMTLTGKPDANDFVAGGRRVTVSASVENIAAGLAVRLSDKGID